MKKIVLFLVLFCTTTLFSQTFTVDNIIYTASSVTEVRVTGNTITTPTSITIPSTVSDGTTTYAVTGIWTAAFSNCAGLTSITILSGVTSIWTAAFSNCAGLTSISLPSSVTTIGSSVFYGCTSLTSITIPNSVTSIGNNAFQNCTGLSSITIPNSVTSIVSGVFYGCSSLTSITLPNSVTSIGINAFYGCTSLTSITLPNSMTSIGSNAFYSCTSLTSITLPNTVTSIGSSAFRYCFSLSSISLPNTVTGIGNNAFQGCSSLLSITLPTSLTTIGSNTFYGCTSLTSITIQGNVTSIGSNAFLSCTGLTSFTINAVTPPNINSSVFSVFTVGSVNLYVPTNSKAAYKSASVWNGFKFPPYITSPGSSTANTSMLYMNENSTAVTTFTADETVTWSLGSSNDLALFSINSSSGVLDFLSAPDYESTLHSNTYIVQVKATDTVSGRFTTQQLTISITNVADTPALLSNFNSFTVSSATSDFTINPPTSNSTGAITYTSSNPAVATIIGTTVHLVGPGTTTITATQAADGSYLGNSISTTMTVSSLCGNWGYSLTYP